MRRSILSFRRFQLFAVNKIRRCNEYIVWSMSGIRAVWLPQFLNTLLFLSYLCGSFGFRPPAFVSMTPIYCNRNDRLFRPLESNHQYLVVQKHRLKPFYIDKNLNFSCGLEASKMPTHQFVLRNCVLGITDNTCVCKLSARSQTVSKLKEIVRQSIVDKASLEPLQKNVVRDGIFNYYFPITSDRK